MNNKTNQPILLSLDLLTLKSSRQNSVIRLLLQSMYRRMFCVSTIKNFPLIQAANYKAIHEVIEGAIPLLKALIFNISKIMKEGYDEHSFNFLNEGGKWELIEITESGAQKIYSAEQKLLNIKGNLTITPPDHIEVENGRLT